VRACTRRRACDRSRGASEALGQSARRRKSTSSAASGIRTLSSSTVAELGARMASSIDASRTTTRSLRTDLAGLGARPVSRRRRTP
jgi:hypothetical protein